MSKLPANPSIPSIPSGFRGPDKFRSYSCAASTRRLVFFFRFSFCPSLTVHLSILGASHSSSSETFAPRIRLFNLQMSKSKRMPSHAFAVCTIAQMEEQTRTNRIQTEAFSARLNGTSPRSVRSENADTNICRVKCQRLVDAGPNETTLLVGRSTPPCIQI